VRRGPPWALGVGAALIAIAAARGAEADVVPINFDQCSASCIGPGTDSAAADDDESAGDVILSLSGGEGPRGATDRPDLLFDPKALPPILVDGLPSPIAAVGAETPESPGVSPYAFFREVAEIRLPSDARTGFALASLRLFSPSTIGRLTLTDLLSNSNDLFKPPPPRPAL
jgi:hypothetical protein